MSAIESSFPPLCHTCKSSMLRREREVGIDSHGVWQRIGATEMRIPWEEVEHVYLQTHRQGMYHPTRHGCTIRGAGRRIAFENVWVGLGAPEYRTETYHRVVSGLVARLVGTKVRFRHGSTLSFLAGIFTVLLSLVGLGLGLAFLRGQPCIVALPVVIGVVAAFYTDQNRPRPFDPAFGPP